MANQRHPSIHITEEALTMLIEEELKWGGPLKFDSSGFAKRLLERARSYSLSSRTIHVSTEKLLKKAEKVKLASRSNASEFAQALLLMRRKLRHRGVSLIKTGDRDWLTLKEICKLATEFCNEFSIGPKLGYREYCEIGLSMMKMFSLNKFKTLHSAICSRYEAMQVIKQDRSPQLTELAEKIYGGFISEKIGTFTSYKKYPEKYQYFCMVHQAAKQHGIDVKTYIKAQFEGFEWANTYPDPSQLVGDKALSRLGKYAFANQIKLGSPNKPSIDFKSVKHAKSKNNRRK